MLVAIHQPNFLPWLGYFDKIARADRFVILDSVPLQLTGGNYTNRVKMIVSGKPAWITMPLRRGHEARNRIDQAEYVGDAGTRRKIVRASPSSSKSNRDFLSRTRKRLSICIELSKRP